MEYKGVYGRGLTKSSITESLMELDTGTKGGYWEETAKSYSDQLREGLKSYGGAFNEAVDEAYGAYQRQQRFLNQSDVVGTGKSAFNESLRSSYLSAYDTYRQNLSEGASGLYENYTNQLQTLSDTLDERANNFAEFGNKHYEYLQYLYNKYYISSNQAYGPWSQGWFKNMFVVTNTDPVDGKPVFDENNNPVTDEQGNQLYEHLRSMQSLYNASTDEEGVYTSVYDDDGYLTEFGRAYFDLIENMEYGEDAETFGDWLYKNNQELWEYMYESPNIFDTTASQYGNVGTFKELTGREARDYEYSIAEHFSAMSKGTIKSFFNDIYSKIDEVFSGNLKDVAQTAVDNAGQIVDQLEKLANDLGIQEDFGDNTWNELRNFIKMTDKYTKSGGKMTGDFFAGFTTGAGAGSAGAMASIVTGPAAPFIGPILALIGVGSGIGLGSTAVDNDRKQNEFYANQLKNKLKRAVDIMVGYSLGKREGVENPLQYGYNFAAKTSEEEMQKRSGQINFYN